MEITIVPTDSLTPYANNARIHSDRQIKQIAASIQEFGFTNPILTHNGTVIAGHGRLRAALLLELPEVPTIARDDLSEAQWKAYAVADNRLAEMAEWDTEILALEIGELQGLDFDLEPFGIDDVFFEEVSIGAFDGKPSEGLTDPDDVPEPPTEPITKTGDLWLLGDHRLLCGDSTDAATVARLMNGEKAALVHADPPYGMGKENEGIQNDNLYREKLDAFQMEWWKAVRPNVEDNGSAYIWGNAPDLWRLWYVGGLRDSERLTLRNEVVWDKVNESGLYDGNGIGSEIGRMYANNSERCLFFMLGEQGFNNNVDNYWDGWEGIRSALLADCEKMGWDASDIERITGVGMYGHWFTKSQWTFIPEKHYKALQTAANNDAFKRDHDELKQEFYATRAYFNNTHGNMTDVWDFNRVKGDERHGHATPKPVAMMERVMNSSLPKGGLCVEPFLGSGTTLIAAERTGRKCYGLEIDPTYCDVIVARWEAFTGKKATLKS